MSKAARVLTTECLLRQSCRPAPTARAALPAAEEPGRCRSRPSETVTGQEYFLSHCRPQRPRLVEATSNPLFSAFTFFLSSTFSLLSECPVWVPAVGGGGGVGAWGRHTGEQNSPAITGLTTRWALGWLTVPWAVLRTVTEEIQGGSSVQGCLTGPSGLGCRSRFQSGVRLVCCTGLGGGEGRRERRKAKGKDNSSSVE